MFEPTHVFALRHGQTAYNATQRLQGQLDIGLDDTGRWQAARLAAALADAGLVAVHASDLARARDTATAVAAACGLGLQTHAALRERHFGVLEGLSHAEIEERFPDDARRWRQRDPGFGPGGGESPEAFSARCVAAFTRLAQAHPGQTIAIVAHGGVLDCLYRAASGIGLQAPRTWQLTNAAINRMLYTGEGFRVVGWDDRRHLEDTAGSAAEEVSA
ncbi:MAG: histidine phosphatase family protein [Betaproteobacteria bacterium]